MLYASIHLHIFQRWEHNNNDNNSNNNNNNNNNNNKDCNFYVLARNGG